jgi:hypothetical protein
MLNITNLTGFGNVNPVFPFSVFNNLLFLGLFNETSGTTISSSVGSFSATLTNTNMLSTGIVANGLLQNGSQQANFGASTNLFNIPTDNFCVFFWVFMPTATSQVEVLDYSYQSSTNNVDCRGLRFVIRSTGQVSFNVVTERASFFTTNDFGIWDTGIFLEAGWNLVVCNRTLTQASAIVYTPTTRLTASVSYASTALTYGRSRIVRCHAVSAGPTDTTINAYSATNSKIDILGVVNRTITDDEAAKIWNYGIGIEPKL